jgi:hypothetical protein
MEDLINSFKNQKKPVILLLPRRNQTSSPRYQQTSPELQPVTPVLIPFNLYAPPPGTLLSRDNLHVFDIVQFNDKLGVILKLNPTHARIYYTNDMIYEIPYDRLVQFDHNNPDYQRINQASRMLEDKYQWFRRLRPGSLVKTLDGRFSGPINGIRGDSVNVYMDGEDYDINYVALMRTG